MASLPLPSILFRVVTAVAMTLAPTLGVAEQSGVASPEQPAVNELPPTIDVELHRDGLLVGQLVTESGVPQPNTEVTVLLRDGRQAVSRTNEQGGFAFRGVKGAATIQTPKALACVRAWSAGTAPPRATPALLLVEDVAVARGQYYPGNGVQNAFTKGKLLMANPLFVAGVIGTAVAIPVAIANDDDPAS